VKPVQNWRCNSACRSRHWTTSTSAGTLGNGQVIGINARHVDGSKKRLFGGQSGLTYADGWDTGDGPILLVEGGSDTAALMTIGLSVVGRPSNTAGVKLLIDLLCEADIDREIVVIGERDEKADGRWPGRDGAISTAKQLAENLERPVAWSLCPDGAKDTRHSAGFNLVTVSHFLSATRRTFSPEFTAIGG